MHGSIEIIDYLLLSINREKIVKRDCFDKNSIKSSTAQSNVKWARASCAKGASRLLELRLFSTKRNFLRAT